MLSVQGAASCEGAALTLFRTTVSASGEWSNRERADFGESRELTDRDT